MRNSQRAIQAMEQSVLSGKSPVGVVLRYGYFYGPGTSFDIEGDISKALRKRAFPLIGGGTAVWSLIHVNDAAEATRLAIESAPGGIYNIVDDRPSKLEEWLPGLAKLLGVKPPMRMPAWLGRFFVGESGVYHDDPGQWSSQCKSKEGPWVEAGVSRLAHRIRSDVPECVVISYQHCWAGVQHHVDRRP